MLFIERDIQRFIAEWRQVQNRSLKVVNVLLNIVGRLNIVQTQSMYKELSEFSDLSERITYSLYEQVDLRIPQLSDAFNDFKKILESIHKWQEMAHFRINDRQNRLSKIDQDYTKKIALLQQVLEDIDTIVDMFESELRLKGRLLEESKSFDALKFNFYLTIWVSEPYLEYNNITQKLEKVKYLQKLLWSHT